MVGNFDCIITDTAKDFRPDTATSVKTAHKNAVRSAAMTRSYFLDHDTKILKPTCGRRDTATYQLQNYTTSTHHNESAN